MRQLANQLGSTLSKIQDNITITCNDAILTITKERATEIIKKVAEGNGLSYTRPRPNDENHWYGTIAPMLAFVRAFTMRINEVRLGKAHITTSKTQEGETQVPVSTYGLSGRHHILLEGSSYPPQLKSNMPQSLGPMTIFIQLARTPITGAYSNKWKRAAKICLTNFTESEDIIAANVSEKPAKQIKEVMSILADILLITTGRTASREHFPAAMLIAMVKNPTTLLAYTEAENAMTQMDCPELEHFNFSGEGAFAFYKKICDTTFVYPCDSIDNAQEIVFHGVWGTHVADLNLLQEITGHSFKTRAELENAFKKKSMKTGKKFTPIKYNKYSKLTSPCSGTNI